MTFLRFFLTLFLAVGITSASAQSTKTILDNHVEAPAFIPDNSASLTDETKVHVTGKSLFEFLGYNGIQRLISTNAKDINLNDPPLPNKAAYIQPLGGLATVINGPSDMSTAGGDTTNYIWWGTGSQNNYGTLWLLQQPGSGDTSRFWMRIRIAAVWGPWKEFLLGSDEWPDYAIGSDYRVGAKVLHDHDADGTKSIWEAVNAVTNAPAVFVEGDWNVISESAEAATATEVAPTLMVGNRWIWNRSDAIPDHLLPLNGQVIADADTLYPDLWSVRSLSTLIASFNDTAKTITLKDYNGQGRFARAGTTSGVEQNDATAPNSLRLRTASSAGGNSFNSTTSMFTNTGNGTAQGSVILTGDGETRPINVSEIWTIIAKPWVVSGNVTINQTGADIDYHQGHQVEFEDVGRTWSGKQVYCRGWAAPFSDVALSSDFQIIPAGVVGELLEMKGRIRTDTGLLFEKRNEDNGTNDTWRMGQRVANGAVIIRQLTNTNRPFAAGTTYYNQKFTLCYTKP